MGPSRILCWSQLGPIGIVYWSEQGPGRGPKGLGSGPGAEEPGAQPWRPGPNTYFSTMPWGSPICSHIRKRSMPQRWPPLFGYPIQLFIVAYRARRQSLTIPRDGRELENHKNAQSIPCGPHRLLECLKPASGTALLPPPGSGA